MIKYLQGRVEAVGREGRMYMECINQMVRKRQTGDTELPDVKPKPRLMGRSDPPPSLSYNSLQLEVIPTIYFSSLLNYIAI